MPTTADKSFESRAARLIERGLCGAAAYCIINAPDLDPRRPPWGVAFQVQAVYELEGEAEAFEAARRWMAAGVAAPHA